MFWGAIVLATTGPPRLLNYKINKVNFVFGLFLKICNYNSPLNEIYCQFWYLLFLRKTLVQIYCNLLFSTICYSTGWTKSFIVLSTHWSSRVIDLFARSQFSLSLMIILISASWGMFFLPEYMCSGAVVSILCSKFIHLGILCLLISTN